MNNTKSNWVIQEFGFPKGRRNIKETNLNCAEREFFEETGYEKNMYDFLENYPIIEEDFIATNNIPYKHKYYLVKLKQQYVSYLPILKFIQKCEVKNIGWYTVEQCNNLIRDYDIQKKNMIKKVYNDLVYNFAL